jgi:hypothetical protein
LRDPPASQASWLWGASEASTREEGFARLGGRRQQAEREQPDQKLITT